MARYIKLKRKHDPADWRRARFSTILFDPRGSYPRGTFATPTAMFHADNEIVFAAMLAGHPEFCEEATVATFIALDASHELVLRHLRANGIANPSSTDAGNWLYVTFDEPMGVHGAAGLKYFEEFYAQRVQTVHPGSRYGDVPFAPVMANDYIHLREALPGVFGYLVLGEHNPFFWRGVADRKAKWGATVPSHQRHSPDGGAL